MDIDPPVPPSSTRKKLKFTPKPQKHKKKTPVLHINASDDDDVDAETKKKIIRKVNERLGTQKSKVEKKSSGNIATSHGTESSRAVEQPKDRKKPSKKIESSEKSVVISSSTVAKDESFDFMLEDDEPGYSSNSENEYKEPWGLNSYNPISLPLRPPGSGNPEVLNEQEFGVLKEYEETKINSALELGLNGPPDYKNKQMIFFQFPEKLPLDKQVHQVPVSSKGKEKAESSSSLNEDASNKQDAPKKHYPLKDLPNGHLGKMLVYKSGAIKFKLGDIIFDVSSGTTCGCYRSAAMMNTETKNCCVLGTVDKQALVTPDVNSLLDSISQL